MSTTEAHNPLYPIFLKVDQLNTLIVGGGEVGSEKLRFMLKSSPNAKVTLVAPNVSEEILQLTEKHPQVSLRIKPFEDTDLDKINVAIIATENHILNLDIRNKAKAKNILTNVADTPAYCDFYLGSIVTKGDLKIAISTNGKSPTFAKRFREVLEDVLPDSLNDVLNNLRTIRDNLKGNFSKKVDHLNKLTAELVEKQ